MRPDGAARRREASTAAVVTSVTVLTPRMVRVRLGGESLRDLRAFPGQTVQLLMPGTGGPARRDYTVRHVDPAAPAMDIDFALHADGPATRWARQAEAGQAVEFVGPSGRHWPDPTAGWHLFAGDETALPAIAAMAESLPADARACLYLEVADAAEEQPVAGARVRWLHRGEAEPGGSTMLEDALAGIALPPGRGRIWVAGHTPTVRRIRAGLLERRAVDRRDLYVRGFWDRTAGHPRRVVGSGR
ncbi:MAG: siderophore-interacting protein [Pseudonocardiaceae bacterium]